MTAAVKTAPASTEEIMVTPGLFINLGTKDGFYKASFLQFILDESNLKKEVLGKIDMRDMNSWVEVDKANAGKMIKCD